MGVRGDRGLEVQGVGQVQLAVDVDPARDARVGEPDVEVAGLGGGPAFGLGGLGVEPGRGLLDQPTQLRGPDRVRERRDLGVHERRRLRGQAQGAVGDEREPPRRQLTRLDPGPAPREPVAPLDRVGQVAAPGLGGRPSAAANSTTANSATSGHPSPPSGREDSCHPSAGPTSDSAECIAAHLAAALSTSRAASSSTRFWSRAYANTAAGSSAPRAGAGPRSRSS